MRRVPYAEYMEYINEYRDGDIFYHVSLKENIQSLLQSGFDQNQIGTQGGCQGGSGFSCTWSERDARDWGQKIYGWGSELHLAVVKVSLPGVKLATHQQADEASQAARQWGLEQGYLLLSDEGLAPSEKLQKTCNQDDLLADWGWAIIGLYLQSQGYDGYFVGMDEVIIMNFSILGASAFELVVR